MIPTTRTTTRRIVAISTIRPISRPGKIRLAGIDTGDYDNNLSSICFPARYFLMIHSRPRRRRAAVFLFLGGLAMISLYGCQFASDREQGADKDSGPKRAAPGERFAEDREPADVKKIEFDGNRAMQYLKDLCAIGPRISGSEGMAKQRELLQKHFEKFGA